MTIYVWTLLPYSTVTMSLNYCQRPVPVCFVCTTGRSEKTCWWSSGPDRASLDISGIATGGSKGAEWQCPSWQQKIEKKFGKNRGKSGKHQEKEEKLGRKGKNWEGSFTLSILTDRAGYTLAGHIAQARLKRLWHAGLLKIWKPL